jgi:23S rRNA (adenine2503-C2)-methyltransferase
MTDAREDIFGRTIDDIREITREYKLPEYTAMQITDWLYKKGPVGFASMTNLSKSTRNLLEKRYYVGLADFTKVQFSADGTRKYLFPVKNGRFIESVYIPERKRNTICISSQVGCKMGCVFCMTGKQDFQGNLSPGEILNQVVSMPERNQLTNYVFMGMGEPLANTGNVLKSLAVMTSDWGFGLSPSRITVSTIGMLPGLEQVLLQSKCHIAISLHSPFPEDRLQLMPVEKSYPIIRIVDYLKKYELGRQRRISFEYIMFRDLNDTARHVNGLTRLLNGLRCRLNLIRFHPVPGVELESSREETIQWFSERLNKKGITTTVRASRGLDIFAACGMLSTRYNLAIQE